MPMPGEGVQSSAPQPTTHERLDSWKEIAAYLKRDVRTVRRWESSEKLPVHRHRHRKGSSVYAYKAEVDAWWRNGQPRLESEKSEPVEGQRRWRRHAFSAVVTTFTVGLWFAAFRQPTVSPERQWKLIPLTTDPGTETSPSFSPSGEQVAFVGRPEGSNNYDIYVKDLTSGDILRLTEGPEMEVAPAWSPDGSRIAFLRPLAAPTSGPAAKARRRLRATIYSIPAFGGREVVLAKLSGEWSAPRYRPLRYPSSRKLSWSPDGRLLAFHDKDSPREPLSIYLLSVESGKRRKMTSPPASVLGDTTPAFSPDGRTLVFVRRNSAGPMDLYKISVEGGTPTRLTFDSSPIMGLAWTPDGREILFSSTRAGGPNLWSVPVLGGAPRRLPSASAHIESPAFSSVGNRLAFVVLYVEEFREKRDLMLVENFE